MTDVLLKRISSKTVAITLVSKEDYPEWVKRQSSQTVEWLKSQRYKVEGGSFCAVPGADGKVASVVVGLSTPPSLWDLADLPFKLPKATYHLLWNGPLAYLEWLALGWQLGSYTYTRYKKSKKDPASLLLPKGADASKIKRYADALFLARDLINTPAEDMGPEDLAAAIKKVGQKYKAKVSQIVGSDLLKKNYPAVHTVGRASARAPRLVELTWGNPKHRHVALVGKGVCFDTGGLDLKTSSGMYLMKKDMGGAACALAVAQMVMDAKLPVYLRLLVPAVENSIGGNAYRPSHVLTMRSGLTVEVGNTDAEGRLILADALAEASSKNPEMILDFSTLTGAARVALGPEVAALFCNDNGLATSLAHFGQEMEDPVWRLPLVDGYRKMLESTIADCKSAPNSSYAGAITAALFLQQFVKPLQTWAHFDMMAWNVSSKPGRPEGGEAMTVRTVFRLIESLGRKH